MIEATVYSQLTKTNLPVYPIKISEDVSLPAITYFVVAGSKKQNLNTGIFGEVKRFQVDVWADSYKDAKEIGEQVVSLMQEIEAQEITMQDLYEDDTKTYRNLIEFYIKE